jgi:transposase InsO family protein
MLIVIGPPTAAHTIRFLNHVIRTFRRVGIEVRAVRTDNGPEWITAGFRAHLAAKALEHHRILPRSPNHNAVRERFHGTALQECWRPAFHRRRFTSIRQLQAEADTWLVRYHHRRRNPQRLHARPHNNPDPPQPPPPSSIMTTSHRHHHLSPRTPAGKV